MKNIELTKKDVLSFLVTIVLLGIIVFSILPKHKSISHENVKCDGIECIDINSHGVPYDEAAVEAERARLLAEQNAETNNAIQNTASNSTQSTQPASTSSTTQTTKPAPKTPTYTEAEIEAAWSEASRTEATCAIDGKITYKNSLTGKTKTETIPATGEHTYKETNKVEATCTEEGSVTHTCTVCGDSYTETIPATNEHSYKEANRVEATCTKEGTVTHTCTICGDSYTETIPATGHKEGKAEISTKAGFFHEGTQVIKCSTCGEMLSTKVIPQTFPISFKGLALIVGIIVALATFIVAGRNHVRKVNHANL